MATGRQVYDVSTNAARVKVKNTFIDIDDTGEIESRRHHRGYSTLPVDFDDYANATTLKQGDLNPEAELPKLLGFITAPRQPDQKSGSGDHKVRFEANRVKVKNTFIEIENEDVLDGTPANRRRNFRTSPENYDFFQDDAALEKVCTDAGSRPVPWERNVCFGAEHVLESQRLRSARAERRINIGTEDLRELYIGENMPPRKIHEQQPRIGQGEQYLEEQDEARSISHVGRQVFNRTDDCFEPRKVQGSLPAGSRWDGAPPVEDARYQPNTYMSTSFSHVAAHAHGINSVVTAAAPAVLTQPRACDFSTGRIPVLGSLIPPGMEQQSSHPYFVMPPWASNHASVSYGQADFSIGGPGAHLRSPVTQTAPTEVPQTLFLELQTKPPSLPCGAVAANPASLPQPLSRLPIAFVPTDSVNTQRLSSQLSPTFPTYGTHEASGYAEQASETVLPSTTEDVPVTMMLANRPQNKRPLRLWAHIYLHMATPGFDLVPMLIGRGGANMRKIAEATNAKIRVRGRGSGHLEVNGTSEAPTPLMVAVTCDKRDNDGFKTALEMTVAQLRIVERRFRVFCDKEARPVDGPCFSIGLLTDGAEELLGNALDGVPFGHIARGGALVLGRGSNRVGGACAPVGDSGESVSAAVAAKHAGVGCSVRAQPR